MTHLKNAYEFFEKVIDSRMGIGNWIFQKIKPNGNENGNCFKLYTVYTK